MFHKGMMDYKKTGELKVFEFLSLCSLILIFKNYLTAFSSVLWSTNKNKSMKPHYINLSLYMNTPVLQYCSLDKYVKKCID